MVAVWVTEPEVDTVPIQGMPFAPPPLAAHCVARVEDQSSWKVCPTLTDDKVLVRAAVRVGAATTVSITVAVAVPRPAAIL